MVSAPVLEKADVQKAIWSYAKLVFGYGPMSAQPNSAQLSSTQRSSVQLSPAQRSPAQHSVAQPGSAQLNLAQPGPGPAVTGCRSGPFLCLSIARKLGCQQQAVLETIGAFGAHIVQI